MINHKTEMNGNQNNSQYSLQRHPLEPRGAVLKESNNIQAQPLGGIPPAPRGPALVESLNQLDANTEHLCQLVSRALEKLSSVMVPMENPFNQAATPAPVCGVLVVDRLDQLTYRLILANRTLEELLSRVEV